MAKHEHAPVVLKLIHYLQIGKSDEKIVAIEIGVLYGDLSCYLLKRIPNLEMILIDPWHVDEGYLQAQSERRLGGWKRQKQWDEAFQKACGNLAQYAGRFDVFRETSSGAVKMIGDAIADIVFIDGDHREKTVREDIANYWPKVKAGGILSGHDFSRRSSLHRGIVNAVTDFSNQTGLRVHTSGKPANVWWIHKHP